MVGYIKNNYAYGASISTELLLKMFTFSITEHHLLGNSCWKKLFEKLCQFKQNKVLVPLAMFTVPTYTSS